jgi:hypothetical protein
VDHWIDFRLALKIDLRGRPDCPSGPPREIKGSDLSQATSQKLAVVSAWEATVLSQCREPDLTSAR